MLRLSKKLNRTGIYSTMHGFIVDNLITACAQFQYRLHHSSRMRILRNKICEFLRILKRPTNFKIYAFLRILKQPENYNILYFIKLASTYTCVLCSA